ncbi:alkaline phosphatase [Erythrobacteraceae bacterium CFH 75059]|uniref:alkaline phosphatase D family protein n=1 Tax=Qipengyuania thermophila TaxID=2509361 RepID=UPI00102258DB|nr:alkaline phosphatase D family protein [Qipengyuania thermophila]TCD06591.1 alkaline phosphatase [Erythrobacteraceae bacterium CFH 75059]
MTTLPIDRRGVLGLVGAGTASVLPGCATTAASAGPLRFDHGVASGDPAADGAVIWTRVTRSGGGAGGDVPLRWTVSAAPGGAPVRRGTVMARAAADHTAKAEVTGLAAGRDHWYRFVAPDGSVSPEGRFRTLPVGPVDETVFAVASCQLYPGGYFNAYADMAALPRLDAVLMLGDYIYEYGVDGYGADIGRRLGRLPDPAHETVTLADYRRRHAQVKSDPDMQAAHARAAFICVWDDHEVTNDGWIGGAENHRAETQGSWAARKAAAMQAYFEWMPIRDPAAGRSQTAIYRAFEFGDLATLAMVETRLLARDEQAAFKGDVPGADEIARVLRIRDEPGRELLGAAQSRWLEGVLARSARAGKPWQVIGNQTIMARVDGPDLRRALGEDGYRAALARVPEQFRARLEQAQAAYRAGVPFNLDAWDGYPHARERLYRLFARAGCRPVVVSGDSHAAWANNLHDAAGTLRALEAGCTAITSPSYGSVLPGLGRVLAAANAEVAYCNQDAKGYTLLTLTPQEARAEFIAVSSVTERPFTRSVDAAFAARPGAGGGAWHRPVRR